MAWRLVLFFAIFFLIHFAGRLAQAAGGACDCPVLSCSPQCEIEQAVTCYSERCPDGIKVRSCAKPTCIKIEPEPASCKAQAQTPTPGTVSDLSQGRQPASQVVVEPNKKKVGVVEALQGQAWLVTPVKAEITLKIGDLVNEKDRLKTGPKSRLELRFDDGNSVVLAEDSELNLSEILISSDPSKRNVLLQLLKGKVKSRVEQKYQGAEARYRVTTKSAVAGVRGTEFVVELIEDLKRDERRTVVTTFHGAVELKGHDRPESANVRATEMAQFVEKDLSRENEPNFIARAYLSQVKKISPDEIKALRGDFDVTDKAKSRQIASQDLVETCENPKADFNQCRWQCRNNPEGESTCRTDLPGVDCVRSVCKASGQWRDDTRLPASYGHLCEPKRIVVGPCDY